MHTAHDTGSTVNLKMTLIEFLRWPLEERRAFIEQQLPDSPAFIKAPLLRPIVLH
jgi:hypothetical protein